MKHKLISQTYDGAMNMAGEKGGVQGIIKRECPNALFVHCYANQLNLVLLYGAKHIKEVNLTAFHSLFHRSPKRMEVLREKGFSHLGASETRLLN